MGRNGAGEGKEEKKQTGKERKSSYQRPSEWFKCSIFFFLLT